MPWSAGRWSCTQDRSRMRDPGRRCATESGPQPLTPAARAALRPGRRSVRQERARPGAMSPTGARRHAAGGCPRDCPGDAAAALHRRHRPARRPLRPRARPRPAPGNPARVADPVALLDGVRLVVVRLLGGRRAWDGFDALPGGLPRAPGPARRRRRRGRARRRAGRRLDGAGRRRRRRRGVPARGRPGQPRPAGRVPVRHRAAHRRRLRRARRRCRRTACTATRPVDPARPTVGVVFYRAHELSGNTVVRRRPVRRRRGRRAPTPGRSTSARCGPTATAGCRSSTSCSPTSTRSSSPCWPAAARTPATPRAGTPPRSPASTCRCCRRCA